MARRKKIKIKYKSFLVLCLIVIISFVLFKGKSNDKENIIDFKKEYIGKDISQLQKLEEYEIKTEYEYSDIYEKNVIIDIDNQEKILSVKVSQGKLDDTIYIEKKVNELGNVPIMMYHGIVDTEDNKYTGGNVDKDGYNRTSKAFREDLEFYYNNGYRMIRLSDYINGIIDVPLGYSPIIITFDDGNRNNCNILGRNSDGSLQIDPNSAVGILEEFKKKHSDVNVTATFFLMDNLFNQKEYNEEIMEFLVNNGYDIGNHTTIHANFTEISVNKTQEVVGKMHQKLENILGDKYSKIIALPFGSPYKKTHENYPYILKGNYNGYEYETKAALRVGWEPEVSPFNKQFDKDFLKRCRAYDNNGKDFDIEMVFKNLEKNRYISDGNKDLIVINKKDQDKLSEKYENIHTYEEVK